MPTNVEDLPAYLREAANNIEKSRSVGTTRLYAKRLHARLEVIINRMCTCEQDDACCQVSGHDYHVSPHQGCMLR